MGKIGSWSETERKGAAMRSGLSVALFATAVLLLLYMVIAVGSIGSWETARSSVTLNFSAIAEVALGRKSAPAGAALVVVPTFFLGIAFAGLMRLEATFLEAALLGLLYGVGVWLLVFFLVLPIFMFQYDLELLMVFASSWFFPYLGYGLALALTPSATQAELPSHTRFGSLNINGKTPHWWDELHQEREQRRSL